MRKPIVTILLATYNRAHLIGETLDSIIAQTYTNWECIIIDDNSTDTTKEVVKKYIKHDKRFIYFLKTDKYKKGLSGTRNYGLEIASQRKAKYIQLFDDDDIMHPKKIELQIKPFLKNKNLVFTTCKYKHYCFEEDKSFKFLDNACTIFSTNLFEDFYRSKVRINSLGPLWRANVFLKYRFDEELLYSEEKELYLRIFLNEKPNYEAVNQVLFYYRKHSNSNTQNRYSDLIKQVSNNKLHVNLIEFAIKNSLIDRSVLKLFLRYFAFNNYNKKYIRKILNSDQTTIWIKIIIKIYMFIRKVFVKLI